MRNSNDNNKHNGNSHSTSTLEDRHFLSDPRPVRDLKLPTWEVDIHREGVDMPIMTLRVDSTVLPPRKNKKKKVLWKLPDNIDTAPKFGEQDKRRVLELFREKKKELKKLKNKQRAYRRASSMESMNSSGAGSIDLSTHAGGGGKDDLNSNAEGLPPEANGKDKQHENQKQCQPTGTNEKNNGNNSNPDVAIVASDGLNPSSSKTIEKRDGRSGALSPPGFGNPPPRTSPLKLAPPGLPSKNNEHLAENNCKAANGHSSSLSPATSNSTSSQPPLPSQNGHHPQQHLHHGAQHSHTPPPPPPPGLQNIHDLNKDGIRNPKAIPPQQPPMAIGPCFVLPPNAPPGMSIGKFVTETYYLSLRNGLVRELDAYYYQNGGERSGADVAKVCKAVTVGGAHAFCTNQQDRLMQLNTFSGTEMRIKGVQEQLTVGNGVLVLITGVSIRFSAPNGSSPQQLPFCHTLILAPVSTRTPTADSSTIGYQILNDNLVILTADE